MTVNLAHWTGKLKTYEVKSLLNSMAKIHSLCMFAKLICNCLNEQCGNQLVLLPYLWYPIFLSNNDHIVVTQVIKICTVWGPLLREGYYEPGHPWVGSVSHHYSFLNIPVQFHYWTRDTKSSLCLILPVLLLFQENTSICQDWVQHGVIQFWNLLHLFVTLQQVQLMFKLNSGPENWWVFLVEAHAVTKTQKPTRVHCLSSLV